MSLARFWDSVFTVARCTGGPTSRKHCGSCGNGGTVSVNG